MTKQHATRKAHMKQESTTSSSTCMPTRHDTTRAINQSISTHKRMDVWWIGCGRQNPKAINGSLTQVNGQRPNITEERDKEARPKKGKGKDEVK
mmetsp:Transcript_20953/g.51076  ORF Transcript_20953/g.51076 Transcript_20953/m.51076 type:complete len:94 (-) Transcript_20953:103-384(-)